MHKLSFKFAIFYKDGKSCKKTESNGLRPVYIKRLRHPLKLMMDVNAFYIEMYKITQALSLGVNGP